LTPPDETHFGCSSLSTRTLYTAFNATGAKTQWTSDAAPNHGSGPHQPVRRRGGGGRSWKGSVWRLVKAAVVGREAFFSTRLCLNRSEGITKEGWEEEECRAGGGWISVSPTGGIAFLPHHLAADAATAAAAAVAVAGADPTQAGLVASPGTPPVSTSAKQLRLQRLKNRPKMLSGC